MKTEQIRIRLTPQEKQAVKGLADNLGLDMSNYLRQLALRELIKAEIKKEGK